uniref:Transposase n=1 Tax=Cyprinus carpio TaxID=7962 RepID=A0A8C2CU38_CYPCA
NIAEEDCTFARWTYAHYFEFVRDKEKKNVICHATTPLTEKRKKKTEDESDKPKQQKLSFSLSAIMPLEPREFRRLVAEYVVEDMLPLLTVESSCCFLSYTACAGICSKWGATPPTPPRGAGPAYIAMVKELKKTIDEQQYVSTTADIWTAYNRRFFGVTVHWIDSETLQRKKAVIACRRFRGRHTYDAIASELEDIFSQYGLTTEKVTACVTDNGSNFIKAFKEYQQVKSEEDEEEEVEEDDGKVAFTDLHSALTAGDDEDAQDHRCAAHTLNLIANNEIDKWLCSALWTKASWSTVASECLEVISERKLTVPSVTRWNSFYDAYVRIIEMPLTDINNLCTQLQIKCMNDREYQFLKEYCSIMKPFSVALDILQGEETCFYGTLQPTFEVLIAKTLAMQNGLSQMTTGLPEIIVGAIKMETEVTSFFNFDPVMECLHQFPRIKKIPPTPSSAPVERLYSLGSLVLTPKRNRLGDGFFQRLILMRFNRYFSQVGIME